MTERASLLDFWRDCHGSEPLRLLVERPPQAPQGVVLQTPFAVLGRDEGCDIVVRERELSRRHVYLQVIAGQLWAFDLASRTGMRWRGHRLSASTVTATDPIRLGPCRVQPLGDADFSGSGDADPLAALPEESDRWPTATLEFQNAMHLGGGAAPVWQLDRALTFVGQALQCKVRFKCPSVSRVHCALLRTASGVWLIDLLGRDGVQVNGARVRWAKLTGGARLRVGRFDMLVHEAARRAGSTGSTGSTGSAAPRISGERAGASMLTVVPQGPQSLATLAPSFATQSGAPATVSGADLMIAAPTPGSSQALAAPLSPTSVPEMPQNIDSTQAMLLTMMSQFSTMQQQMFDQFQQTTLMMMQMFGSLQKDQFELVRQELEGLRELNREINTLQTELANHKTDKRTDEQIDVEPPSSVESTALTTMSGPRATEPRSAENKTRKPRGRRGPKNAAPRRDHERLKPVTTSAAAQSAAPQGDKAAVAQPAAEVGAAAMDTTPAGVNVPPDADVHEWLCQRFADLQQERQTRWQRLMGVLTGK